MSDGNASGQRIYYSEIDYNEQSALQNPWVVFTGLNQIFTRLIWYHVFPALEGLI
jgi:hypothetical protein